MNAARTLKNVTVCLCVAFSCLATLVFGALADVPEDSSGAEAWRVARRATIEGLASKESDEAIPALGEIVRQLYTLNYRDCPELSEVRANAVEQLLAIPGHARFYDRQIKEARERMNAVSDPYERGPLIVKFQTVKADAFTILSYLPSPETVEVLGELLFDDLEKVPPSPPGTRDDSNGRQYETGMAVSSAMAVSAFARLPLASKPVQRNDSAAAGSVHHPEDLDPWRLWYEQVRAGTRTFRFEGDPREYSLKGPVDSSKSVAATAERSSKAGQGAADSSAGNEGGESSRPILAVLVGAVLICAVAAWSAFRKRDRTAL